MNVFVKVGSVQETVGKVMPSIFKHEEDSDLVEYLKNRRKGDGGGEPTVLRHGVEEPAFMSLVPCCPYTVTYQI